MITVLTPTYNRKYTIDNAYNSLLKQTDHNFEWIIVDDGSTDNTKELITNYIKQNKIKIRYYYKKNGGKHTALNYGISKARGELLIILDSDDKLTPDAIEKINVYWEKYKGNKKISSLSFLRINNNNNKIGKAFNGTEIISNYIDFRYNKNVYGDMAEVFKTSILKSFKFPTYNNEKFLSEAIIWIKIALKYDTVYINEGIYICDYLSDGLSKNFFKIVANNPIGASENANQFLIKEFKLSIKIKNAILYNGYCKKAKKNFKVSFKNSNNKILTTIFYPAGILYYIFLTHQKSN